jgi:hypothetical protein
MLIVFAAGVGLAGEATLAAPTSPVAPGEPVSFTFVLDGESWLDGCAPVELERQEGARWVALPRTPCSTTPVATRVDGSLVLTIPPPGAGVYRAVVAVGTACQLDRAFVVAGCQRLAVVRSAEFSILPRPEAPK